MNHSLSKKFIFGSLLLFTLPTIAMMMVMSLYIIVDGALVSRFVSANAFSLVNIVYPVTNIVLDISVVLSMGSNATVTRKVGEGWSNNAREILTVIILLNIIVGLALTTIENLTAVSLFRMLGTGSLPLEDRATYLRWQLASAPSLMLQIQFQMYFVTEGEPSIGLFLTLLAGIVNIMLDYVLIVPVRTGIVGAAIATATGYTIPALTGLIYLAATKQSLRFVRPRSVEKELGKVCLNGSSEMVMNLSPGTITFLFDLLIMHFAGENGVTAIVIIQYSQFLLNALLTGFSQGVSPTINFNYGSRNHKQLRQISKTSLIFTVTSSLVIFLMARLGGNLVVGTFTRRETPAYELARHGLMIFACSFLFSGFTISSPALFTVLSDRRISVIVSFVRILGLTITSLLVLLFTIGMDGMWLAVPITRLDSILLYLYFLCEYKTKYYYA